VPAVHTGAGEPPCVISPARPLSPGHSLRLAFSTGPSPIDLGQNVAHLLGSNQARQDFVVAGVMRAQ
jgi:hypothetical protein